MIKIRFVARHLIVKDDRAAERVADLNSRCCINYFGCVYCVLFLAFAAFVTYLRHFLAYFRCVGWKPRLILDKSSVDVECLLAAFFWHAGRHNGGHRLTTVARLTLSEHFEASRLQLARVVDHLNKVLVAESRRLQSWRVKVEQ